MNQQSARDRLSKEKQTTIARIASLTADIEAIDAGIADSNSDDEHDPEGSTLAFERARISRLLSQDRDSLHEIECAEDRLARGMYGTCEHCGAVITSERLEALPGVRLCVQCRSISG